jgi:hypothetical protein
MIEMPETRGKFFSVRFGTKIQGVRYIPSVCYPLSTGLQAAVEEMAAKDLARIYTGKVRFVTGVPYPVKKAETDTDAPRPSSVPLPDVKAGGTVKQSVKKAPAAPEKPRGRRSGRNTYTSQVNREFD